MVEARSRVLPFALIVTARLALIAIACLALAQPAPAFPEAYLPLDHWAYPILERLRVRGAPIDAHLETLPISRGAALASARATQEAVLEGRLALSEGELGQLALLEREFRPESTGEPANGGALPRAPEPRYHARRWDEENLELEWALRFEAMGVAAPDLEAFDPGTGDGTATPDALGTVFLWARPQATLRIASRLLVQEQLNYRLRSGDTVSATNLSIAGGEAEFVHDDDDAVAVQRTFHTLAQVLLGPCTIAAGRIPMRWGPGRDGTLLLSDTAPPTDFLRIEARAGRFLLTNLATELRSDLGQKWMAAHRIDYSTATLTLGVTESVIFGNRGFDFAYLSPFQLLYIVEDNIGALDNNLVSVDARWVPAPGWQLHGEFLVDDSNLRDGWSFYGNKNAFQVGAVRAGFPSLPMTDVEVEWSLVDQYTYTHNDDINAASHYDAPIGHRIGTDADLLGVTLRQWVGPLIETHARYEQERHGEGDLFAGSDERADDRRNFLSGTVERARRAVLGASYRSVRGLELRVDVRRSWIRAFANDAAAKHVAATQGEIWVKCQF